MEKKWNTGIKLTKFDDDDFENDFDFDERSFIGIEILENPRILEDSLEEHYSREEWNDALELAEGIVLAALDLADFNVSESGHEDEVFYAYAHDKAEKCVAFAKAVKEKAGRAGDVWTLNEEISYVFGLNLRELCELVGFDPRKFDKALIPIDVFDCQVAFETKFKDLVED